MIAELSRRGIDRKPHVLLLSVWLSCAAMASPAGAHEYWLTLSDLAPRRGQTIEIGAASGVGFKGEAKRWNPERCVEFAWSNFRRYSLAPMAPEGESRWGWFTFPDTGGVWVQFQSNFAVLTLASAEFDSYLADEGLAAPLAVRRKANDTRDGRERYRRCAKAWVAGTDTRRAGKPLGQPLELVPLALPGAGAALRVRVLWQGKPLAGALVRAWRQPLTGDGRVRPLAERDSVGMAEQTRSDARGDVLLAVGEPGEWLLSVVHMVPSADPVAADWESTWASLTFVRRAPMVKAAAPTWP